MKFSLPDTSAIASSAPAAMAGVRLSMGPVKLRSTPSLTSVAWPAAMAAPAVSAEAAEAISSFFMSISL